jgi:Amt family ammonium transporter
VAALSPLRVSARDEGLGLDVRQHGEEAYVRGEGALLILRDALPPSGLPAPDAVAGLQAAGSRS